MPPRQKATPETKRKQSRHLATMAARVARDRNCEEIIVLDLCGLSPVTDYFVIATGTSDRQLRAVADEIADQAKEIDQRVWHVAGKETAEWLLLDFVDVVVHLFEAEHRRHYDLEMIWGEAPRVDWERTEAENADGGA